MIPAGRSGSLMMGWSTALSNTRRTRRLLRAQTRGSQGSPKTGRASEAARVYAGGAQSTIAKAAAWSSFMLR